MSQALFDIAECNDYILRRILNEAIEFGHMYLQDLDHSRLRLGQAVSEQMKTEGYLGY